MNTILLILCLSAGQETVEYPPAGKNLPEEPVARSASPARAAAFLDSAAVGWTRRRRCVTCHTNLPYLWARPSLKAFDSPAMGEVRGFLEKVAETWEADKPVRKFVVPWAWNAQIVATAVTLAVHDARTTGKLHPLTRKALDAMWTLQKDIGSWNWPDCDWPPMERDEYFGAAYVAIGVGTAPEGYAASEAARPGLERLRRYFKTHPAPDLHHRLLLLWASIRLDGLMGPDEREAARRDLLALQRKDGGWCLPSFGDWTRHDGTPNAKDAPSDGYATGLAVYVLRMAGLAADHPQVRRGVEWLKANQRESGRWFTRSLGADDSHYLTHIGTAYAVMALDACGELREPPLVVDLWPGQPAGDVGIPGEERFRELKVNGKPYEVARKPTKWLTGVTKPTLTIYRPEKEKDTGVSMLICPGGGYHNLGWDVEGEEVAAWLNSIGVTGILLKYRCPRRKGDAMGEPPPGPLKDAQRAVSLVRSRAKEWGLDPQKIGMVGFSAGGHLVGATATNFEQRTYEPIDEIDQASCRPDFAVMLYSGYFKVKDGLSPTIRATAAAPPMFLVHPTDDPVSDVDHSVTMYLAMKRAGVSAELHVYASGGHGFGVRKVDHPCVSWTDRCVEWLQNRGFLRK